MLLQYLYYLLHVCIPQITSVTLFVLGNYKSQKSREEPDPLF